MLNQDELRTGLANDGLISLAAMGSLLTSPGTGLGYGVKALDGRYRQANPEMERILCPGTGRLAGKLESDFLPADLLAQSVQADRRILDGALAASVEVELPVNGQNTRCLWLKLAVLGPHRELQAIASIIHEVPDQRGNGFVQQKLERLLQANRALQLTVDELEQAASTDKLTGVWNRRRLEECAHNEMDRLNRYQHPLCLLIIDIDFFKRINDENGHSTGDLVLQALTGLLRGSLRGTDSLARWGGEEFVVMSPNTHRATAAMLAERLREQVARATFPAAGQLTVSIGVAECRPGEAWEQWFERADEALYCAKNTGRNQVRLAPEAREPAETEDYVVANFVQLVWRAAYESGDERIDDGHRQLFADANELLAAILSGQAAAPVIAIVDALFADVVQHFRDEETIIAATGFPAAAEHVGLHRGLVEQARHLVDGYHAGNQGVGDVFQFLAYDVITKHMLGADRQFFRYLQQKDRPAGEKEPSLPKTDGQ